MAEEDLQLRQSSWSELLSSREHMWYRTLLGVSIQFLQQVGAAAGPEPVDSGRQ